MGVMTNLYLSILIFALSFVSPGLSTHVFLIGFVASMCERFTLTFFEVVRLSHWENLAPLQLYIYLI